ncbi:SH3 domain-containing protein [Paraburkholderia sp. BL10I2N1]|uniref:SH3 domain-containing protein n=1 Tax=Paraburkholderia sp. BL10I2N1 TaxID=1938796 RepID=UPI00105D80DD|nr:SH3 domain-containing protein [Paraburkholderia sp. BL10I2N1]TDN63417.1 uncharacterized protein YraI [Paraburkholderia sp. BL10I2N1]
MRKQFMSGICAGLAALSMLSGTASAQEAEAYTNSPVYLYAGPGEDYPVVAELPASLPLTVMGCISDYTWCDVAGSDIRGWVYAAYLSYPYQGSEVPIMSYGTVIGLPIITFAIGSYWGHYYRDRPWYHDRDRWAHRPPPGQPRSEGHPPVPYPWHGGGGGRPSDYDHGGGHPGGPPPGQGGGDGHPPAPPQGHGGGDGHPPAPPQGHGGGAQMGGPPPGQGGWDSRPHAPPQGQGGWDSRPHAPPQGQGGEGAHPPGPSQGHGGGAQMGGPPPGQSQGGGGHPGGSPQVHESGGGNSRGQADHGGPPLHN